MAERIFPIENTLPSWKMGVEMLELPPPPPRPPNPPPPKPPPPPPEDEAVLRHSCLPVFASTPTSPPDRKKTYCFCPPTSAMMGDELAVDSPEGRAHFQITEPSSTF